MNFRPLFLFLAPLLLCAPARGQGAASTPVPRGADDEGPPVAPPRPQPPVPPFATVRGFALTGYLRSRVENFRFFEAGNGDGSYTFTSHQLRLSGLKSTPKYEIGLDLQAQLLTGLPDDAFFQANPTTSVPLGLGGNYYAANGGQDGALNLKQAFVRFKNFAGAGSAARLGRFEFNEGAETTLKDPTLNFLKTQRIAQRLIGTFAFTHTGRAFDGGQLSLPVAKGNLTLVGARPTAGVFQLEANDNVDAVDFLYGAYTQRVKRGEARVFGLAYEDGRETPKSVKVDNRPLALRQTDDAKIRVYTLGANYLRTFDARSGKIDLLVWGALQTGDWGAQDHSGRALALEAGYQPSTMKLKPWLRLGYYAASGDGDPIDGRHTTFFTPLPTPRQYARFPFYNGMNLNDGFAQLLLRPNAQANLRLEAHSLRLNNANDLFYAGGGTFADQGFGFGGQPSGGRDKLATVFDVSFDYTFDPKTSLSLYFARALGGGVIRNTFTQGDHANYAFVEFMRRF